MISGISNSNSIQTNMYNMARNVQTRTSNDNKFLMRSTKAGDITQKVQTEEPLDYYYEFVKRYPDISFRLTDNEDAAKHPDGPNYGYKGHMNQVGSNFGDANQISVDIDVEVIRRMMKDDEYAKQVDYKMRDFQENFASWKQLGLSGGDTNFYMFMEVGKSGLVCGVQSAPHPIFTEEQRRALWAMYDTSDNRYLKMLAQRRDELEEDFMKMVAERPEDRLTYDQIKEKWNIEYQKMYAN